MLWEQSEGLEALVNQVRLRQGDLEVVEQGHESDPHFHHGQVASKAVTRRNRERDEGVTEPLPVWIEALSVLSPNLLVPVDVPGWKADQGPFGKLDATDLRFLVKDSDGAS